MCKLEELFDELVAQHRLPEDERDRDYVEEIIAKMVKEPFPTTLENARDYQILDEVNWRGIEDDLDVSCLLSDFADSEILEELDNRSINLPNIVSLYHSVQNQETDRTLDIIREICYYYTGRLVTVDKL